MRVSLAVLVALATPARADAPAEFVAQAKLFYRVVACGGSDALPAQVDHSVVDKHCEEMAKRYQHFTDKYITPAQTFFATVRPANLPATVVYPFGGGDLAGAL